MSVSRRKGRQVPLTHVAHLAGEAFGYQPAHDGALAARTDTGRVRSALALALVVCLLAAAYLVL